MRMMDILVTPYTDDVSYRSIGEDVVEVHCRGSSCTSFQFPSHLQCRFVRPSQLQPLLSHDLQQEQARYQETLYAHKEWFN